MDLCPVPQLVWQSTICFDSLGIAIWQARMAVWQARHYMCGHCWNDSVHLERMEWGLALHFCYRDRVNWPMTSSKMKIWLDSISILNLGIPDLTGPSDKARWRGRCWTALREFRWLAMLLLLLLLPHHLKIIKCDTTFIKDLNVPENNKWSLRSP